MAETADLLFFSGAPAVTPIIAVRYWKKIIPMAPIMRILRRPNLSMIQKLSGVEQVLTSDVISEIRNGFGMVPRLVKKTLPK